MAVDHKALVAMKREAAEMADISPNGNDQTKRKPRYYEGVYMNDQTISANGDVTPALLRSPISRGLFNLPRYVPKYTINSRLRGQCADDTFSNSKASRTYDRKFKDGVQEADSDSFGEVPVYRDRPDVVGKSNGATKEPKKSKERKKSSKRAESEQRKACCSKCCSVECCTPKCRRCACILVIIALIAAALLALALGLYFGYFEQFGDSYPMKANFTVTNGTFPEYLSDLTNPNTISLTKGICDAFEKTLRNVSQIQVDVSSCSAVGYTNGSINALFNIDVRHKRDEFANSGDAFSNAVSSRVTAEFRPHPPGYFVEAVSNSVLSGHSTGTRFNVVLNEISWGHFSPLPSLSNPVAYTATPTAIRSVTTHSISKTNSTPKYSATSAGSSTPAVVNGSTTGCANSTAPGCGNSTRDVTTTSGSSAKPTSFISSLSSSLQSDSPTAVKPSTSKSIQASSTRSFSVGPSSTVDPTTRPSSTQASTKSRTTTASTSTRLHSNVTTTATFSVATSASIKNGTTTSERKMSGSTSQTASSSTSK